MTCDIIQNSVPHLCRMAGRMRVGAAAMIVLLIAITAIACSSKEIRKDTPAPPENNGIVPVPEIALERPQVNGEIGNGRIGTLKNEPPKLKKKDKKIFFMHY